MSPNAKLARVPIKDVQRFMTECFRAVGCNQKPAEEMAELLLAADKFGHPSHGLNRLENYLKDIKQGICAPNEIPKIIKKSESTAVVDAMNVLGATSSHFCMDLAMSLARKTGFGWVTARGANHYGMAGWWGIKAAKQGFIGMSFSNTSPFMAPTRSKKAALGTNPLAVVAPGIGDELFYLEMATTAVAYGMIEIHRRLGEPLHYGWAQGPDGEETLDPEVAIKTHCLMPVGGSEAHRGYKGYGLATMVELFSGLLSGSNYGHKIRSWGAKGAGPANLGQAFVAIDLKALEDGFRDRLTDMLQYLRKLEPADPNKPVLAPGDIEWIKIRELEKLGSLPFSLQQLTASADLAKRLKVKPLEVIMEKPLLTLDP